MMCGWLLLLFFVAVLFSGEVLWVRCRPYYRIRIQNDILKMSLLHFQSYSNKYTPTSYAPIARSLDEEFRVVLWFCCVAHENSRDAAVCCVIKIVYRVQYSHSSTLENFKPRIQISFLFYLHVSLHYIIDILSMMLAIVLMDPEKRRIVRSYASKKFGDLAEEVLLIENNNNDCRNSMPRRPQSPRGPELTTIVDVTTTRQDTSSSQASSSSSPTQQQRRSSSCEGPLLRSSSSRIRSSLFVRSKTMNDTTPQQSLPPPTVVGSPLRLSLLFRRQNNGLLLSSRSSKSSLMNDDSSLSQHHAQQRRSSSSWSTLANERYVDRKAVSII